MEMGENGTVRDRSGGTEMCVFATRRRSEKEGGRQSWDIQGCKTATVRGGGSKRLLRRLVDCVFAERQQGKETDGISLGMGDV